MDVKEIRQLIVDKLGYNEENVARQSDEWVMTKGLEALIRLGHVDTAEVVSQPTTGNTTQSSGSAEKRLDQTVDWPLVQALREMVNSVGAKYGVVYDAASGLSASAVVDLAVKVLALAKDDTDKLREDLERSVTFPESDMFDIGDRVQIMAPFESPEDDATGVIGEIIGVYQTARRIVTPNGASTNIEDTLFDVRCEQPEEKVDRVYKAITLWRLVSRLT